VPSATYSVTLDKVERAHSEKYGPGVRWVFIIAEGEFAGRKVARITGDTPSPRNAAGKLLGGMVGRPLQAEEVVDIDSLLHRRYIALVAETETGSSRVEAILGAVVNTEAETSPVEAIGSAASAF
jgi:hypothetical protein